MADDGTSYWPSYSVATGAGEVLQILGDGGLGYALPATLTCGSATVPSGHQGDGLQMRGQYLYRSGFISSDAGEPTISAVGAFDVQQNLSVAWQYCVDADENFFFGEVIALGPDGGVMLDVEYLDAGEARSYGFGWVDPPGVLRWKNRFPASPSTVSAEYANPNPAVGADGTIYLTSDIAPLIALNGADGTVKWVYDAGAAGTSSPAIGADGTIYFDDADGYLNAVR